ncbi:MAG: ABC transporter permease [Planctomycetes bacterium]|nr:ABC transporter permease [Planctomycetota bacterium]
MGILWQDIRYAGRMLTRSPGLAVVVILILAVGIGANTAVFSVVNAVILRPLPYPDAGRLVALSEQPRAELTYTLHGRFLSWRAQNQVFEKMGAYWGCRHYLKGIDRARYVRGTTVSPDLLALLGVPPSLGRGFLPDEDQPGKERVMVLSNSFWREDFGGDPNVIGKVVTLDGQSHTIVGVMPPHFQFPPDSTKSFWVPLVFEQDSNWPLGKPVEVVARLKKGTTLAQAAMTVIANRLRETDPKAAAITVGRMLDRRLGANRQLLWLLLGAAGLVLLIACTNVASLLLARATTRQREIAMRVALGASRPRLLRQMLTESLLLSLAGGILGLLVTFGTVRGIVRLCPADIPRLKDAGVDGMVLAFTLVASVLTGLFFGVVPACRASDVHVSRILKEGQTRSSTGRGWRRLHGGLVIAQIGLSLILLIGAALLVRTWIALQRVDLGFDPKNVLSAEIILGGITDQQPQRCHAFFDPLLERVRTLPRVQSAGYIDLFVLGMNEGGGPVSIVGHPPVDPEKAPLAYHLNVRPGFFETMGARLLKGRTFTEKDMSETAHLAIVDEDVVRKLFGDLDPIGQRIQFGGSEHTVVGVVRTLRDFRHLGPVAGIVYLPHTRYYGFMCLLVRAQRDPLQLIGPIRAQMAELDKAGADATFEPLEARLADMLAPRRFSVVLLGLFGGIALILATVGIYGLLQYSTAQQTHDIGIRMAIGAGRTDVLVGVLRHGLRLTLVGVVIGLAGAYALTRLLTNLLYGVPPTDLPTFIGVSLVLLAIALLASYLPARRAARIDPMEALRYE